jgi:UMF1 family MFS transporter
VFNNAMMPSLVPPERLGRLSGTGWAIGYVGGLLSLLIVLGFLAGNPQTGKTLLGATPLFGLDPALREGDRAVGPLSALWFVAFVLPLFLFTPDVSGLPLRTALRSGIATLGQTLRALPRNRTVATFLLANMIYTDGMLALFVFGGIYAAGTFGWGTIQIGIFGILLNITAMAGAYFGGKLDDRFGSRAVILGSLAILIVSVVGFLSIGRDHVLFIVPAAAPVPGAPPFSALGEKLYVAVGLVIGLVVGPAQAASRTLMVRLAPAGRVTQFFGLLALSGKVTSFTGPLLVALVTTAFASQKAGMAVLVVFFALGALILSRVRA